MKETLKVTNRLIFEGDDKPNIAGNVKKQVEITRSKGDSERWTSLSENSYPKSNNLF